MFEKNEERQRRTKNDIGCNFFVFLPSHSAVHVTLWVQMDVTTMISPVICSAELNKRNLN